MTLDNLRVTFQEFINDNEVLEALLTAAQEYSDSQNSGKPLVSLSLPPNVELKDIKDIRNYFGEHDVTVFEHKAFAILDSLVKHLETCGGNAS